MNSDDKHKMITFTGRLVDPFALTADDIHPADIVHHLCNICRYTGACDPGLSVGQHSILVSWLAPEGLRLAALLHDAAESYFNDIARPTKYKGFMAPFRAAEKLALNVIGKKFGVSMEEFDEVKKFDNAAHVFERERIMPAHEIWEERWAFEIDFTTPEKGNEFLSSVLLLDTLELAKRAFAIELQRSTYFNAFYSLRELLTGVKSKWQT